MSDRKIGDIGFDTAIVIKRLRMAEVGDIVPYTSLTELLGRDIQKDARSHLMSARHHLQKHDLMVFATIRKVGIQRLSDSEIVESSDGGLTRMRRMARREAKRLTSIQDYSALSNELRIKHNANLSVYGALGHLTKPRQVALITKRVTGQNDQLALNKTLEAFFEG